ncbi:hypothetical protein SAMN04490248_104207 [Salinihabitans flavidus]|uniref:Amidohydrolase 3 domain-containing protein n=1 Tax=Salinihabitans flavidus TaxID=569882 RepID=A0A1H8PA80_9RHOB|nr:amidohydrolase [Salinihabitans flavidus]SEO38850.1 hypothetical protein SAMN04490248_104207 [Salinihabitans flavidus]
MLKADKIWTDGHFLTLWPEAPEVTAMAEKDGRIIAVGPDSEIETLKGPGTKHIRMHGRFAMPGLIESHTHALWGACRELFEVYVGYTATLDTLLHAAGARTADVESGRWITGGPWRSEMREGMGRRPRDLLDRIAPAHPVALADVTQHSLWCNSRALDLAGISTSDRFGGGVERGDDGHPTGILHEAACAPVRQMTTRTPEELSRAVSHFTRYFASLGYTGFKEPMATEADLAAYASADAAGKLPIHMAAHIACFAPLGPEPLGLDELTQLKRQYATENLRTGFAKLFLDGVAPSFTASFLAPYVGPDYDAAGHDPNATLLIEPEALNCWVTQLDAAGFVLKMHAVGDNAVRKGLDAVEAARLANGPSGPRHELSHSAFIDEEDLPRFAQLNAVAEVSPKLWMPNAATPAQLAVLGQERMERCHPIRDLLRAGAEVIFGTDWPAAAPDANPWTGLAGMITRRDSTGRFPGTVGPDQAITLEDALPLFTVNAARALGMEGETGQLRPGAWADFIVPGMDIRKGAPDQIAACTVQETVWKGQTIHTT